MVPAQQAGALLFPLHIDVVDLGCLLEKTLPSLFLALLCAYSLLINLLISLPFM